MVATPAHSSSFTRPTARSAKPVVALAYTPVPVVA
jgi:hypothetical protein